MKNNTVCQVLLNILALAICCALACLMWDGVEYIHTHSGDCKGKDCDWYWCPHYNGK